MVDPFEYLAELFERPLWRPYPWQIPPDHVPTQGIFLIEGGRGIGKTDGCSHYMIDHVNGPPCDPKIPGGHRMAIVAPTLDDAAESCVTGPSGLRAYDPSIQLVTRLGGSKAVWPTGAEAKLFSGQTEKDADRLRAGGNRCLLWIEEAAAIPWLAVALQQGRFGLRVGPNPHIIASSTPKPTAAYKALRAEPNTIRKHGTTEQAHHLAQAVRDELERAYGGLRLGRQELDGELLDDIEGALWKLTGIDAHRADPPADLDMIGVGVDPSATEHGDETGIIVAGQSRVDGVPHLFPLDDYTGHYTPAGWGDAAIRAFLEWDADAIIYETNQGGEMVRLTLEVAWKTRVADAGHSLGPPPTLIPVHAARGKRTRAEPIAALQEKGQVHHPDTDRERLAKFDDELTQWVPGLSDSPNRLDAWVHVATWLWGAARGAGYGRRPA